MEAIEEVIAQGKQVLYLVPEIGLTPQTCGRLEQRFEVCVLHSKLSEKDRLLAWELARTGAVSVVVGTRSALFTPLPNLGLIVIDEEHDSSFKQDTHLRYHARDVAIYLANKRGVPVVLGSATPSAESYRNAIAGRYRHLQLTERATGAQMPKMEVIDAKSLPHPDGISQPALHAIRRTLPPAARPWSTCRAAAFRTPCSAPPADGPLNARTAALGWSSIAGEES